MAKSFKVTAFPADISVVTLSEAKDHLRVSNTDDDTLITNLILAATQAAQNYTNRFFINHSVRMDCDTWDETLYFYKSPVFSSTTIEYYGTSSTVYDVWDSVNYIVDKVHEPARLLLQADKSYPTLADRKAAIKLTYVSGYGTAASDVPQAIKQAVLLMIGNFYENRQEVVVGRIATEMPKSAQYLLDQYKVQIT
tara:strand:- start:10872 stop:11456 length:585 start_codon:yes stop_codon:yes gene_type:complete